MNSVLQPYRPPSEHYENFPVASWLCPPRLRPPIAAIYWFARTADDIADEGDADAASRLADLAQYREDLRRAGRGTAGSDRWPDVFGPLAAMIRTFRLPLPLLERLLDAFEQDVRFTADARRYRDEAQVLDYCTRSADPVGRLLLHLYDVHDAQSLQRSDQICTALQLINFWQDLRRDIARGRWYLSQQRMEQHGVTESELRSDAPSARATRMMAACCADARQHMLAGAPLARQLPGRAGWELRLVVAGGLRILDKIAVIDHATWRQRPRIGKRDVPMLLWNACRPLPICEALP
ncbi:squalene synthase HpnC [Comamonadaceae bacterium G21597-S1]|nr:squalene synthase HpnC [Comamonadaceae bacterium G21597-S1]